VYVLAQVPQVLDQVTGDVYDTVLADILDTLPTVQASLTDIVLFGMLIPVPYVLHNRFYSGLL
jgi:hypothetical protein